MHYLYVFHGPVLHQHFSLACVQHLMLGVYYILNFNHDDGSSKILIILVPFFTNENSFSISAEDISGGGFVDYETNTCIKADCKISNSKSTKPPPEMKDFRLHLRSGPSML